MTDGNPSLSLVARRDDRSPGDVSVFHAALSSQMSPTLLGWVWSMVRDHDLEGYFQANPEGFTFKTVYEATTMNDDLLLDVVDSILQQLPPLDESGAYVTQNKLRVLVAALQSILAESGSAFTVDFSQGMRLVRRVDTATWRAGDGAAGQDGHASDLLKSAGSATFNRDTNPSRAYQDAMLAVESVACQAFIPVEESPTLGKAISYLQSTLTNWTVATLDDHEQASAETLLAMLKTVWRNHQRHVGAEGSPAQPATQDEAEAVFFLAATIVQWFEHGLVKRV